MSKNDCLRDAGVAMWGGSIDEGLALNSTFCPGYNDIAGYIDKMLSAKRRKCLEDHLASCKECRFDIQELRICIREIT